MNIQKLPKLTQNEYTKKNSSDENLSKLLFLNDFSISQYNPRRKNKIIVKSHKNLTNRYKTPNRLNISLNADYVLEHGDASVNLNHSFVLDTFHNPKKEPSSKMEWVSDQILLKSMSKQTSTDFYNKMRKKCRVVFFGTDNYIIKFLNIYDGTVRIFPIKNLKLQSCYNVRISSLRYFKYNGKKYLAIGDSFGFQRVLNLKSHKIEINFGKIHQRPIINILSTNNNKYLITRDIYGCVKQICIEFKNVVKVFNLGVITCFDCCDNNLFTGDDKGVLKSISQESSDNTHNFGKITERPLLNITCLGKSMYVCDKFGYQKEYSLEKNTLKQDFGKCSTTIISSIKFVKYNSKTSFIFIGDIFGNLKQYIQGKKKVYKNYGDIFSFEIVMINYIKKFLMIMDAERNFKIIDIKRKQQIRNMGKVISSRVNCIEVNDDTKT